MPQAGTLFVVATPIGNLEDITLRALRVLREVALVAAEDTRRTGNLLRHYQIHTPLLSLHAHNEHQRRDQIVARLLAGDAVALVSDAGTPGISDPGAPLVAAARAAGVTVAPVPGPSAVTAALSASGMPADRFAFAGFPPVRGRERAEWFAWVAGLPEAVVVCFEAPHRISRTLAEARDKLVNRPILLARELTKLHEEWHVGDDTPPERGEFVILFGQVTKVAAAVAPIDGDIARIFGELTNRGWVGTRREAIRTVAAQLGLSPKAVYEALERAKT